MPDNDHQSIRYRRPNHHQSNSTTTIGGVRDEYLRIETKGEEEAEEDLDLDQDQDQDQDRCEGSMRRRQKLHHPKTQHPSFEIIKNKSFGTLMHELWIRFQGEFGLSMLETWEVVMIYVVVILLMLLFYVAVFKYLPSNIKFIARRSKYYLVGSE